MFIFCKNLHFLYNRNFDQIADFNLRKIECVMTISSKKLHKEININASANVRLLHRRWTHESACVL